MIVSLGQLWIPILAAAVGVFVASSLVHMVFKWHNADYRKLSNEDDVRTVLRAGNVSPGQYVIPHCLDMKDLQGEQMQQKFKDGPIAFLSVRPSGAPKMGPQLGQWFVLNLAVAVFAAYLASKSLTTTASFMQVCRVVSLVTFLAYAGGSVSHAIWMGKTWSAAAKEMLDAFLYGLVSALIFGWLWPH